MAGAIDIVVNLRTPKVVAAGLSPTDSGFQAKTRQASRIRGGVEIDDYLKMMDAAGIERSFLVAVRCGPQGHGKSVAVPYQWVADVCATHPDRFSGLAGIDPTRGMAQLRELARAVEDFGFVGAHFYPHWFHMPPDAPRLYPIYAKCCDLGIPIMMQVGQNLIYQKDVRLPSVARPILLDRVAIDFPALKLIGIHIGVPWTDEMIAMARKHDTLYIGGDAYAPKYWPPAFVQFAKTDGVERCLFGTDWPVIDPGRAMQEVDQLGFSAEAKDHLLRKNAVRLFGLPHD